ncbi:DNA-directed DNA polymerase alpha subunit POL12, partial [Ascoidea rubescens DSM 1968]
EQIIKKFGKLADNDDIVKLCQSIIQLFNFDVEQLFINWESEFHKSTANIPLNSVNLGKLQDYIIKKIEKNSENKKKLLNNSVKKSMIRSNLNINLNRNRNKNKSQTSNQFFNSSQKLEQSIDSTSTSAYTSGKIIQSLNSHILPSSGFDHKSFNPEVDLNPIKITANFNQKKYNFRSMRIKLLESADYLDEQIDIFTRLILNHYNFSKDQFGNPTISSQDEIITVGRIVSDSPISDFDTILNSNSLSLETSRISGIGNRISLNLSNLNSYSFFPGQIVAFKGKNISGQSFIVNEVVELPLLGAPVSSKDELDEYTINLKSNKLKIVVISGPYTTNNNLSFENLRNIVDRINNQIKPHLVILFGPFIDITHSKIYDGSISNDNSNNPKIAFKQKPRTLDEVFKFIITPILKEINNKIQVVLIPSLKDATSNHPSYPQTNFDRKFLNLPKNFKCFPNPSSFQINEINVGVSNNDVYKDFKDVCKGDLSKENRFDRISNHLLEQRKYYPLFPGGLKTKKTIKNQPIERENDIKSLPAAENSEHISGSDLDLPYMGLSEFSEVIPDIIIIPSELNSFARVVKNVIFVNPGSLMKNNHTGNYAVLSIDPPDPDSGGVTKIEDDGDDDELYIHNVWKRTRVDIIKT